MKLLYRKLGRSRDCACGLGRHGVLAVYSLEGSYPYSEQEDFKSTEVGGKRSFISYKPSVITLDGMKFRLDTGIGRPLYSGDRLKRIASNEKPPPPPPPGTNLLSNPRFESPLTRDSRTGWSCQGETDDPRGGTLSQYSFHHHGYGNFSGICFDRVAEWAGPGQYIEDKVKSEGVYEFIGYTRLIDREKTGDLHSLELWMRFKRRGKDKEESMRLAVRNKYLKEKGWVKWKTAFQMPRAAGGFDYVFLFFMGPKPSIDILVDDVSLKEVRQHKDWKDRTDRSIDRYRKRDVRIRINVPPDMYTKEDFLRINIKVIQKKHKFAFGAAVNSMKLKYKKYREFLLEHFEWGVLESHMKWPLNEPKPGEYHYHYADMAVAWLERHNISIRGHCIYWSIPDMLPEWLLSLPRGKLMHHVRTRINQIVKRYRGRMLHWDVINEMLQGSFFADRLGGNKIREWMINRTAELDPKAKLFLNEYEVISEGQLTQPYVEMANTIIRHGSPVDALGVQGHFTGMVNPTLLRLRLDALSEVKRPMWLTEFDILDPNTEQRADSTEAVMREAFSHPSVEGIIFWVFWDLHSWRGKNAGLVDGYDFKLNAAGRRFVKLMRKWTTKKRLKPIREDTGSAVATFRGFHGDYDVQVTLPDGQLVRKQFTLEPGNKAFRLDIDIHGQVSNPKDDTSPGNEGLDEFLGDAYHKYNTYDDDDDMEMNDDDLLSRDTSRDTSGLTFTRKSNISGKKIN
ncbi:endo-1,4-beta-xylanase 3 isoform X2 [Nematostella vectensis]|nr:endo-1,4-beta-xylanase 3 isoform X2 [Nematostella vectensis]